ncbi:MAG: anti-sigma factor [Chitinophagaceae bacterium]
MNVKEYIESGIIESYVLGFASEAEIQELLLLCNQYPEIQQAVEEFESALLQTATHRPQQYVKSNIEAVIQDSFVAEPTENVISIQENKPITTEPLLPSKAPIIYWKRWAYAAGILWIISSSAALFYFNKAQNAENSLLAYIAENKSLQANNFNYQTKWQQAQQQLQLLAQPATKTIHLQAVAQNAAWQVTVFWNQQSADVYVLANNLPTINANEQYQLWAIKDGKPVDAGLLNNCGSQLCKLKNMDGTVAAFAITKEKKGGSPIPTLTQMVVLGKV